MAQNDAWVYRNPVAPSSEPAVESTRGRVGGFVAAVVTGAALLAAACSGIWFVVETSKGQLVIESESNVRVSVVEDESSQVVDALQIEPGAKATRLKSGKYEIVIDAASDQFQLSLDTFTIRRGETVVARITRKPSLPDADALISI